MTKNMPKIKSMSDALYAIRNPATGQYWELNGPYGTISGRGGKAVLQNYWAPKFTNEIKLLKTDHTIREKLCRYNLERLYNRDLPELELVTFELQPKEKAKETPPIEAHKIEIDRLYRFFGIAISNAAEKIANRGIDITKFEFAIKRKGITIDIAKKFPDCASADMFTFITDDVTLVQAKLTLGDNCVRIYHLRETTIVQN